jgi:signal transduction histidine kinase
MPDRARIPISLDLCDVGDANDLVPGEYLRLAVVDTGTGMDEATMQRAIDPIFSTKGPGAVPPRAATRSRTFCQT